MRCPACGVENPQRSRFCNSCGTVLTPPGPPPTQACTQCGASLQPGTGFCTQCGAAQGTTAGEAQPRQQTQPRSEVQCTKCGATVPAGKKFCTRCGALVSETI